MYGDKLKNFSTFIKLKNYLELYNAKLLKNIFKDTGS